MMRPRLDDSDSEVFEDFRDTLGMLSPGVRASR